MKHRCHVCKKDYDCEKDCNGPLDYPCPECISKMGVEEQTIQCLSGAAREAIAKTVREIQFRLSAAWKDGFTKHDVRFSTKENFAINVWLTKEEKK